MRFAVAAALVAGASAAHNLTASVVYTTEVLTEYTTYCPAATNIVHGDITYTVTEPTTLTITNCPCTVTKPAYTTHVPAVSTAAPVVPVPSASPSSPVYLNSTTAGADAQSTAPGPVGTAPGTAPGTFPTGPSGTATGSATLPRISSGAAGKPMVLSGAGFAGLLGAIAYIF